MSSAEYQLRKLAKKLDDDDMAVLGGLLQKVANDSAVAGVHAAANQESNLEKIATTLVEQGFSDDEIVEAVEKIAEEQKVAAECDGITQDCLAMGTMMGKQASAVQAQYADGLAEYIGKKAAAICIQNLQGYAKLAQEEEEKEDEEELPPEMRAQAKKMKDKGYEVEKEDEEEEEEEEEKEASLNRKVALLRTILEGTGYGA